VLASFVISAVITPSPDVTNQHQAHGAVLVTHHQLGLEHLAGGQGQRDDDGRGASQGRQDEHAGGEREREWQRGTLIVPIVPSRSGRRAGGLLRFARPEARLRLTGERPRHVLLVAGASVALATLACFTPPPVFEGLDWLLLHLPGKAYAVDSLTGGRLPLWNPHVGLGRPFLADTEMAVLYPPNLLYLLMDPATTLFVLTVGHIALGLAGLLSLGRALGFHRWVAWLISGCFLASAPVVARLSAGQVPYVQASCYLPLLMLLALRLQDGFSAVRLAALATALGLQLLCGHPQIAWVTWLGLGAFLLGRALPPTDRPLRSATAGIGGFFLALLAGLGLCAAMLLPFLELATQGNRAEPSLRFASGETMEWWYWTSLVVPDGGRRAFYWEFNLYAGLLPAVAGLAGLLRIRDRNARGYLVMAVVGALVAAGPRTPVFGLLYAVVPGLAGFHIHARAGLLVVFALLLGAGLYISRPSAALPAFRALVTGSALALAGALAFQRATPLTEPVPSSLSLERLVLAGAVAGLAGLVVAGRSPWIRSTFGPAALSALVLLELGATIEPSRRAWRVVIPTDGERLVFQKLRWAGLYGPNGVPPRVALPPALSRANAGLLYAWSDFAGYNSLTLNRTWVYLHRALGLDPPLDENTYVSDRIYERGPFPYDSMSLSLGWDASQGRLAVRRVADPRAYLVTKARRVGDWREAVALMASGHDFHREALVETDTSLPEGPEAPRGSAAITAFEPERIVLSTESESPALLVLAEAWYPGWSATVDGRAAPCAPANGWMRAVPLPPGRHQVVLSFRSQWLATGALLSFATAVGLLAAAWKERRRGLSPPLTRARATPAR
jgi:hypothetical protein